MRPQHFEIVKPVCPVCSTTTGQHHPLEIARVDQELDDQIIEGILHCSNADCQREYPIIDAIPLIIRDIRSYLAENAFQVFQRSDLGETIESVMGDCCGPESVFNSVRQQLSSYTWDHYGDLDPDETEDAPRPGTMLRVLQQGLEMADPPSIKSGPIIDIGCSVGRSTFALAEKFDRPVLGIDLNFPMLRMASQVLQEGIVNYSRRRVGIVYDRRLFPVSFRNKKQVDFWACDATALPFVANQFAAAVSMNLLDCVHSPLEFLSSLGTVLAENGKAVIASPYDWSPAATSLEGWLGGHSQRGPEAGASEPVLRRLLTPGNPQAIEKLELLGELDANWTVRMHDRSSISYRSHLVVARKTR